MSSCPDKCVCEDVVEEICGPCAIEAYEVKEVARKEREKRDREFRELEVEMKKTTLDG